MTEDSEDVPIVQFATLPSEGVWRIGPATDPYVVASPLQTDELNDPFAGHRFDSPMGNYGVLYFATQLEGCFGETLARFRPDLNLVPLIKDDWAARGFMGPGNIPADWRHRRLAVRATCANGSRFLDVESADTRAVLRNELAPGLTAYGASDLDIPTIRGGDRRITRLVSLWAWSRIDDSGNPVYGGIRYLSRLNTDWECWAVFDRTPTKELERKQITHEMPELRRVAAMLGLIVH